MKDDTKGATEPDLHVQGAPTRVDAAETNFGSNPKPRGWTGDSYSGIKNSPPAKVLQGGYSYRGGK